MAPALNVATAFAAGLVSFVSPCVLPLIPAYLAFITGSSLEELRQGERSARQKLLVHSVAFCLGFSLVFITAGLAVSSLGAAFVTQRVWLARLGGIVTVILGLHLMGLVRFTALMRDRRWQPRRNSMSSVPASFLIGIGFAAGWSPCIGPILASILVLAANQAINQAALLLGAYSFGLALPFLGTAFAIEVALVALRRLGPALRPIEIGAGIMLLITGIMLLGGSISHFAGPLAHWMEQL